MSDEHVKDILYKGYVTGWDSCVEALRKIGRNEAADLVERSGDKPERGPVGSPEPEPLEEIEEVPVPSPAPAPTPHVPSGVLRPFIFSAEGVFGYVNDRPSFEAVSAQFGSSVGVFDARRTGPFDADQAETPTFMPSGQGESLREWLGEAINVLVDTSAVTLSGHGGHNPGHEGCC